MPSAFSIRAASHTYDIRLERDGIGPFLAARHDALLLCDERFAPHWEAACRTVIALAASEAEKTLEVCGRVIARMREHGFTRGDRLVAIGGGIVQDVACFVASVYMRGVAWDYCPTTLLGMADSCIGGKSSINVGSFKNIAGTFHPPQTILIDPAFATSLPREQIAGGLCEAAKICFARGPESFAAYCACDPRPEMDIDALAEVVRLSLQAKQWFIEVDEFDGNERLTLNFGHSFGHALEAATGFRLNHGLAVGVGVRSALAFARDEAGVSTAATQRLDAHLRDLLAREPVVADTLATVDRQAFEQAFLADKKHDRDTVRLILPVTGGVLPLARVPFPRGEATMAKVWHALASVMRSLER
jgi:3-dehydroquinate synthase